jgi:hypothetical protein
MNIKTKFDAGDSIYLIDEGEIINTVITGIDIKVNNIGETTVFYHFGKDNPPLTKREDKIYKDKDAIIAYINKIR